jgi:DNA repair exonuclease SbcCD nuclease subunit
MKILFTADLHIKLGQKNVPIEWQKSRFRKLASEISTLAIECDLIVVGGDIFDRIPSMEELDLYFEIIDSWSTHKVIIYPGNHEALKRNTTFLTHLKVATRAMSSGNATIIDDYYEEDNFQIVPYNKLKEFVKDPFYNKPICFTHVRGEIPPHVKPEVDLEVFENFTAVFAGDLHSHANSQLNIVYPGSPLTTSFHRDVVDSGIIIIDTNAMEYNFHKLELPQLIRKKVSDPAEMVQTDYHHTVYELECEVGSTKVDNELLDKKIVKKESMSTLNLTGSETITDEMEIYLRNVLKLDSAKIKEVIQTFHDNIKESDLE